jgi:hypothetical protein
MNRRRISVLTVPVSRKCRVAPTPRAPRLAGGDVAHHLIGEKAMGTGWLRHVTVG